MTDVSHLKKKQLSLLKHLKIAGENRFKLKIHDELSTIGWHIIHCLYVECIWIRSQFLDDNDLANKLKEIADGININPKNRGLILPNYEYLYELAKNEYEKTLILIKSIREKFIIKQNAQSSR